MNNHNVLAPGANPEFFIGGAAKQEVACNLSFILNIMLQKSCDKYNFNLLVTAFMYIKKYINTFCMTQSLNLNKKSNM